MLSKPKLAFLHGFATDSSVWASQLEEFSRDYEAIALDLDFSNIEEAASRLDLEDVTLVGWSMGAYVALHYCLKYPEKVKALVLVSVSPKFVKGPDFPHAVSPAILRNLERKFESSYSQGASFFHGLVFNNREPLPGIKGFSIPEREEIFSALNELKDIDMRSELENIKVPTLIIHGTDDQICLPEAAKYLQENISGASLSMFDGGAHAPFLIKPDEFNQALRQFLDANY